MKKNTKVLVVGGTGFLGYHFCKKILKKKWIITSISTNLPRRIRRLNKIKYLICDIRKKNQIKKLNKNFDYVINFGGYVDHTRKKKTYQSHFNGCKNLADHFLNTKIKSFIQIGSCVEYGFLKSPQRPNYKTSINNLKSVYGIAKLKASNYIINLNRKFDFPSTVLRLYLVYGPKQDINRFIPIIINGCLKNLNFDTSDGKQSRDFLYVTDLVDVIIKILKNKKTRGKIFNVGSGSPKKLKKIIKFIQKKIKSGKPNFGKLELRKDEILNLYPDIKKTKTILKWKPRVNLKDGLYKTINYYKRLYNYVSKS